MTIENKLSSYHKRRDFTKTKEPIGKKQKISKQPIFVIQKHNARQLHYDFRLEIGKVLKSWAVPKGPSKDPKEKRLAIETDDHPLEYAQFEGKIPEGQYGAGTVKIFDYGTYENIKTRDGKLVPIKKCLRDGKIEVYLNGRRIKGSYVLIRFGENKKNWLLKKMKDKE